MRRSFVIWVTISVLAFAGAAIFWQLGERRREQRPRAPSAPASSAPAPGVTSSLVPAPAAVAAPVSATILAVERQAREAAAVEEAKKRFPHQLTNTRRHLGELMRSGTAVLMQNALIETTEAVALPIPAHLRAGGDPGAYLVQARGPVTEGFRRAVVAAGAHVVAYIPHNTYLVRATPPVARALEAQPTTQAVLPYEPYYKLQADLLARAVEDQALPEGTMLRVTGYPGEGGVLRTVLAASGSELLFEERSPFGPQYIVRPPADALALLAQSPSIQGLEVYDRRALLNDYARVRLGIVTDTIQAAPNHPVSNPLTGTGITLNINDSAVDDTHPDLAPRVTTDPALAPGAFLDPSGHGTHVAGTIISSGNNGTIGTNAPGSTNMANMRGLAFNASLYVLPLDVTNGPLVTGLSDFFLQTNAANHNYSALTRTNPMVSNNSWGYLFSRGYDSSAASFDAAVRDALPEQLGMQSMVYVFAVGNEGFGADNGLSGFADSVVSPATAKNVISVGAIENTRLITNTVVTTNLVVDTVVVTNLTSTNFVLVTNIVFVTNAIFLPLTDNPRQVASFSSRGNVDPGLEGLFGRFKPDVVAPGTFTISTRSAQFSNDLTTPVGVAIAQADAGLNNNFYRFETGTSQAAPAVSGMLALMQEFFEARLMQGYSPALLKGLVINSARSLSALNPSYSYAVAETLNLQGWGLPNITNVLTEALGTPDSPTQFIDQSPTNALATGDSVSFNFMFNSVPTNQPQPQLAPLRVTLVWTDPPGNPNAAIKLVNDLDLVVSNTVTGEIYLGNGFTPSSTFTPALSSNQFGGSNIFEWPADRVNNVEHVVLQPPLGTNWVITVRAARVNVNAITAHTNNIVQDFALIVSTDAPYLTGGPVGGGYFTLGPAVGSPNLRPPISQLTNGLGIVRQRVGANSPLVGGMEGSTNQWRFYVFTNTPPPANLGLTNLTAGSNVAFVTFRPPNLSGSRHVATAGALREVAPRNIDADIDLYVSRDPLLTNLDLTVLAASAKSTNRGGTEFVVFSNGIPDEVFYVGVKSEDYQASEFSLLALSTDDPFCQQTDSNNILVRFIGIPDVADGDPLVPGSVSWIGLALNICGEITLQRAVLTNTITSELFGDTFAALSHADQQSGGTRDVVLLSHNLFGDTNSGSYTFIFDDSGRGDMPGSRRTDAANTSGGLNGYIGDQGNGVWLYSFADNAIAHTTRVDEVTLLLEGRLSNNVTRFISLCGGESFLDAVDIPPNATNFAINVFNLNGGPVEVYVRLDDPATAQPELPTPAVFDTQATFAPPGGVLRLTPSTIPQLQAGRYYILFFNPNATCIDFNLNYDVDVSSSPAGRLSFSITNGPVSLTDDAIFISPNDIGVDREVFSVEVGVRLDHPRVSDLALHLVAPSGARVLLMENRGLQDTNGLGAGYPVTNTVPVVSTGGSAPQTNIIAAGVNSGTVQISFDFFGIPDRMTIYYDGALIYDSGFVNGSGTFSVPFGPGAATDVVIVMNEPAGNSGTAWNYTATIISGVSYLVFTEDTNKTTTPIKFAVPPFGGGGGPALTLLLNGFEAAAAGNYVPPQVLDGWTILTNQVSVIADPALSFAGNNLLALADGTITRVLPTAAGQNYQLTLAYRGPGAVSLWRGESNATDVVSANNGLLMNGIGFSTGMVNGAFEFDGVDDYVHVPWTPSLDVGQADGFTIDGWIRPVNANAEQPLVEWMTDGPTNVVVLTQPVRNPANGHYYYLLGTNTWTSAEAWSIALGGHLATVNDAAEQAWIYNTFSSNRCANRSLWIGLNDIAVEGSFVWSSGQPTGYFNWSPGEPNSFTPAEDHVALFPPGDPRAGEWNDANNVNGVNAGPVPSPTYGVAEVDAPPLNSPGVHFWLSRSNSGVCAPGSLYANIVDSASGSHEIASPPGIVQSGVYQHVALTYDRQTGVAKLYHNGVIVAVGNLGSFLPKTTQDLLLGKRLGGNPDEIYFGGLDEVTLYRRTLSDSEIRAVANAGAAGKFDALAPSPQNLAKAALSLDGGAPTILFGDNTNWQTATLNFTAAAAGTVLDVTGLAPGMLLDGFELVDPGQPPAIYLPEESLDQFRGESTLGQWRLELWDTRVGAAITNGLISWDLRFVLTSPNAALSAIQLANCVTHTNTVIRDTPLYFFIDVPLNATNAINTLDALTGSGLQLSIARFALPVGFSPPDDYPPVVTAPAPASAQITFDTNTPPVLLPGSRYYLRVDNLVPSETNAFALTACIGTDTNLFPFTFAPLSLAPGQPANGSIASGLGIDYYQVTISNDVSVAFFELSCLNGNANLVLRRDNGGPRPLPTRVVYDHGSVNGSVVDEQIGLTTAVGAVPLTPGKWFLGVYNVDSQPVNYCVSVTQHRIVTNDTPPLLTLDEPLTLTIAGGTTTTNLYRFNVDWVDTAALFEVYDVSGDVDLFVGQWQFPSPDLGGLSAARGKQPEQVVVTTNDYWWDISGEYWLAVANHGTNPASFTLRATVNTPEGLLLSAQPLKARPDVVAKGKGLPITWNSVSGQRYQIEMATTAAGPYVPYATVTAKAASTTFTDPTPISGLGQRFFQVRQVAP